MRIAEAIAACIAAVVALLLLTGKPLRTGRHILLVCLWICLLYHTFAEGMHWQLGPLYLAIILLTLSPLYERSRWVMGTACLILTAVTVLLCHSIPMPNLPRPTGAFATGTRIFSVTDSSRHESDGSPRELVVQAWYPADCPHYPSWVQQLLPYLGKAPYRRWKEITALSSYQRYVWTNSCQNGNLHPGSYPVLIFNPGMTGRRTQTTFITEELASHGYIALAIDHPYSTGPVELSDGRVIKIPPSTLNAPAPSLSGAAYQMFNEAVDHETVDTQFVLNQLATWQNDPANPLHGHLNIAKIGASGYSLGGSVAAETAARDPRVRAVFDMSGRLFCSVRQKGVTVPFFYLSETEPQLSKNELHQLPPDHQVFEKMAQADMNVLQEMLFYHGGYFLKLPTGNHSIFADQPLFSPYTKLGGADPEQTKVLHAEIRAYEVAFFDQFLKDKPSQLLARSPQWTNTEWKVYPKQPVASLTRASLAY